MQTAINQTEKLALHAQLSCSWMGYESNSVFAGRNAPYKIGVSETCAKRDRTDVTFD